MLGWVAVAAWLGSLILNALVPSYSVPPTVNGLILIVAGALFGPSLMGRRRNGNGPDSE